MAPSNEAWSAAAPSTTASNNESSKPRARKRRRTAGGAGEDCWTCKRRAVTCDRKRPYCTQCIEIGRECSGYKTVLSWGVGVASRGKLRGMACPVANKNVDGSDISPVEGKNDIAAHRRTSSATKSKARDASNNSAPSSRVGDGDGVQGSMISSQPMAIGSIAPQPYVTMANEPPAQQQRMPMDYTPHQHGGDMISDSRPTDAFHKQELYSPSQYHQPISPDFQLYKQLPPLVTFMQDTSRQPSSAMSTSSAQPPSMTDDRSVISDHSYGQPMFEMDDSLLGSAGSYQQYSYSPLHTPNLPYNETDEWDDDKNQQQPQQQLVLSDMQFGSPFFHMSPRLQVLMEHYNRNVCPFLVAFDGARNPYRQNILQLAAQNEGLQNAIAALSSNNLRMRRKERRSTGFITELPDLSPSTSNTPSEVLAEESCYKQMAIDQLNMQLTDRRAAEDDSVLATLLILCLYHVCDSGFSKFRTQLAGVQKLLAFRNPSTHSDFTRWVQMFFTWFDVLTSTVNEREMEIKNDALSMLDFSTNLGAMEQFSGCDGRLFKLIARLGRLNLLAQGRPVKPTVVGRRINPEPSISNPNSTGPTPSTHSTLKKKQRNRPGGLITSLSHADYNNIDGNGWGTPIISSDEDEEDSASDDNNQGHYSLSSPSPDGRDEFWAEWHEIRNRLRSFETDSQTISPATSPNIPLNPIKLQSDQRDMIHINESFRCAALLYTERLGHPHRPSSHASFQTLVQEALYHIESLPLDSCVHKFLLWPLFLIGTECVDEAHRDLIRNRCIEVQQESGFYNNLSTLDVLERVWAEARMSVHGGNGDFEGDERRARRRESRPTRQAFRWRKAMDRVDGEYIVI